MPSRRQHAKRPPSSPSRELEGRRPTVWEAPGGGSTGGEPGPTIPVATAGEFGRSIQSLVRSAPCAKRPGPDTPSPGRPTGNRHRTGKGDFGGIFPQPRLAVTLLAASVKNGRNARMWDERSVNQPGPHEQGAAL